MKTLIVLSCLCIAPAVEATEEVVRITYGHTRRILNSDVVVTITDNGTLLQKSSSRDGKKTDKKINLSKSELEKIRIQLGKLDFREVDKDKVNGLDGTVVSIVSRNHKATVWSPDYDTAKRRLVGFQNFVVMIFKIAGLNSEGMSN